MLDVANSTLAHGCLLIRTAASVVSVVSEKAMIDVTRKSLVGKALARPDWVKQVLDKIRTEGFSEARRQAFARLDIPARRVWPDNSLVAEGEA